MTIKQDLKAVQKEFKELGKNIEKLAKAIETTEKAPAKKVAISKTRTVKVKPKSAAAKKPTRKKLVKKSI